MAKFESTLNDKHKQKAEEELGETDENRDEKLQLLRVRISLYFFKWLFWSQI